MGRRRDVLKEDGKDGVRSQLNGLVDRDRMVVILYIMWKAQVSSSC